MTCLGLQSRSVTKPGTDCSSLDSVHLFQLPESCILAVSEGCAVLDGGDSPLHMATHCGQLAGLQEELPFFTQWLIASLLGIPVISAINYLYVVYQWYKWASMPHVCWKYMRTFSKTHRQPGPSHLPARASKCSYLYCHGPILSRE